MNTPTLTKRQREIFDGLIAGKTHKQIAADLQITQTTLATHVTRALKVNDAATPLELALRIAFADRGIDIDIPKGTP